MVLPGCHKKLPQKHPIMFFNNGMIHLFSFDEIFVVQIMPNFLFGHQLSLLKNCFYDPRPILLYRDSHYVIRMYPETVRYPTEVPQEFNHVSSIQLCHIYQVHPPCFFGVQILFQTTVDLLELLQSPVHKKVLQIVSILFITDLEIG